jgi:hypothetical protein
VPLFRRRATDSGLESGPRTRIGRWLRAALLDVAEGPGQPGRGFDDWNDDEPAVVEIACSLIARTYFRGTDQVSGLVAEMVQRIRTSDPPPAWEAEAVIRYALGGPQTLLPPVGAAELFRVQGIVLGYLVYKLRLDEAGVDDLISQAEKVAFERGCRPPLAAG